MTLNPPAPKNTRTGKGVSKRFTPAAEAASTHPKKKAKQGSDRVSNPPIYKQKGRPRGKGPPDLKKMGLTAIKGYALELGISDVPKDAHKRKLGLITFERFSSSHAQVVILCMYLGCLGMHSAYVCAGIPLRL